MDNIEQLQRLMIDGGERAFDLVPLTLGRVIEEKQWKGRKDKDGVDFSSFEAFVSHIRWQGLESSLDELLVYCRRHPEITAIIKQEINAAPEHVGRGHRTDIISPNHGTNPTYILKRLKRDRPDLAEKVIAGELSSHAAAVQAGFRKPPNPFKQVERLLPKLTDEECRQIIQILLERVSTDST